MGSDASDVRGVVAMDGLLKYEDLMALLTCSQCQKFCGNSIVQCRKGHVLCKGCKAEGKITSCKICKQTFVDAPNLVLEKLISMIALPCRFRPSGCEEFVFSHAKILKNITFSALITPDAPAALQFPREICNPND